MPRDAKAMAFWHAEAPANRGGGRFDDCPKASRINWIAGRVFAVIPLVADAVGIDLSRRPNKFEKIVLGIAARRRSEFRREGLNRKGMRNVGDRTEPADAGMRFRFGIFETRIGELEGRVHKA
jgi:hypothetical protein